MACNKMANILFVLGGILNEMASTYNNIFGQYFILNDQYLIQNGR